MIYKKVIQKKDFDFNKVENILIDNDQGLTVDLCKNMHANYIIRGVRDINDFKSESRIAQNNKELNPNIETLLINTVPKNSLFLLP